MLLERPEDPVDGARGRVEVPRDLPDDQRIRPMVGDPDQHVECAADGFPGGAHHCPVPLETDAVSLEIAAYPFRSLVLTQCHDSPGVGGVRGGTETVGIDRR